MAWSRELASKKCCALDYIVVKAAKGPRWESNSNKILTSHFCSDNIYDIYG